jgi:glycosyltransferase involved in cell wall biosynthesis
VKILLLHNYYREAGGEDVVVSQEKVLLENHGHAVRLLKFDNAEITDLRARCRTALGTTYSRKARRRVEAEIASFTPDLTHVHNFFPQFSPSVYYACQALKVPVVQTLHNFRLICPSGLLFRDGNLCESCIGKSVPWPGITHACYRKSYIGSAALACMIAVHRWTDTWSSRVDAYITMTDFARQKLIAGGLPERRMFSKPNFIMPDPGRGQRSEDFALFVGRLSHEKGIETLLSAFNYLPGKKLKIIGDGPLRPKNQMQDSSVEFLGRQPEQTVLKLMGDAAFLIFPSECYEGFPRVIVEAYARGLPVLGSRLGSTEELITEGITGRLFTPGDACDLAQSVEWMFTHPNELQRMSNAAREEFESKYTADRNYEQLMRIYNFAIDRSANKLAQPATVS